MTGEEQDAPIAISVYDDCMDSDPSLTPRQQRAIAIIGLPKLGGFSSAQEELSLVTMQRVQTRSGNWVFDHSRAWAGRIVAALRASGFEAEIVDEDMLGSKVPSQRSLDEPYGQVLK